MSSTTTTQQPTTTTSTAMAPHTTSKPSSRSTSPSQQATSKPTSGTTTPSNRRSGSFWGSYNERLGHMYPSKATQLPVEHNRHSKPSSGTNSGTATPDAESKKQHPHFFKQLNEKLDRAFEASARPEADKGIEEAKKDGAERQRKGDIYGAWNRKLEGAYARRGE